MQRLNPRFNAEKAVYIQLIKCSDCVLEIGANVGYFTRVFAHLVGPCGKVVAFEPIARTRKLLVQNLENWADGDVVTVLPYAASDSHSESIMFVPGSVHGQASLRQHSEGEWGVGESLLKEAVTTIPLDHVIEILNLPKVNFIKVDTEGSEYNVLIGAREILLRHHPILHVEIEPNWMKAFKTTTGLIEDYLRGLGYTYFASYNKNGLLPLDGLHSLTEACNVVVSVSRLV